MRCQVWQMLTGAAHDPQLAEAYRLLLVKVKLSLLSLSSLMRAVLNFISCGYTWSLNGSNWSHFCFLTLTKGRALQTAGFKSVFIKNHSVVLVTIRRIPVYVYVLAVFWIFNPSGTTKNLRTMLHARYGVMRGRKYVVVRVLVKRKKRDACSNNQPSGAMY